MSTIKPHPTPSEILDEVSHQAAEAAVPDSGDKPA